MGSTPEKGGGGLCLPLARSAGSSHRSLLRCPHHSHLHGGGIMYGVNLSTLLRQEPVRRIWKSAVCGPPFLLTLGAATSWGQVPATNDTSDDFQNTGGGTGALGTVTPGVPSDFSGIDNTAYGTSALGLTSS